VVPVGADEGAPIEEVPRDVRGGHCRDEGAQGVLHRALVLLVEVREEEGLGGTEATVQVQDD